LHTELDWFADIATGIKGVGVSADLMVGNSQNFAATIFLGLGVGAGADLSSTTMTISQKAPG
jgi:hypothetical protein